MRHQRDQLLARNQWKSSSQGSLCLLLRLVLGSLRLLFTVLLVVALLALLVAVVALLLHVVLALDLLIGSSSSNSLALRSRLATLLGRLVRSVFTLLTLDRSRLALLAGRWGLGRVGGLLVLVTRLRVCSYESCVSVLCM